MKKILLSLLIALFTNVLFAQNTQHSCGVDNIHNPNLTYGSVSDIDGNVYKTIAIGSQVWMAESLKTNKYRNGNVIPTVSSNNDWINTYNTQLPASCWYNNDSTNSCPYGKLYNWHAVNDARKICPLGWHVPSSVEWIQLINYIDPDGGGVNGGTFVGKPLKSTSTVYWSNNSNLISDNLTGFSALGSGYRQNDGNYLTLNEAGFFWSSTESTLENQADYYAFSNQGAQIVISLTNKQTGFCVRCINDVLLSNNDFSEDTKANSIYPNPSNSIININCTKGYQIYNLTGQLVKYDNQAKTQIDISLLPTGVYFLKTDNETFKFIKTN